LKKSRKTRRGKTLALKRSHEHRSWCELILGGNGEKRGRQERRAEFQGGRREIKEITSNQSPWQRRQTPQNLRNNKIREKRKRWGGESRSRPRRASSQRSRERKGRMGRGKSEVLGGKERQRETTKGGGSCRNELNKLVVKG